MRRPSVSARRWRVFASDERGAAAVEFALIGLALIIGFLNMIDIGRYAYSRMEVADAAQVGGQAIWKACGVSNVPATINCPGMTSALTTGVQSTSLGSQVSVASGYPTEGWYCVDGAGALTYVSAAATNPGNCAAVDSPALPGDYVVIKTTYAYSVLFSGLSVAAALPSSITSTTYMRVQ